jgi:hypothetical protein
MRALPSASNFMKKIFFSVLSLLAITVRAQIPITGGNVITLDTRPPASEWATLTNAGAGNTFTNAVDLDAAVQTNTAASITLQLPTSGTIPPSTSILGFRYNTTSNAIQTRVTGVAYHLLKATLQNETGTAQSTIRIVYDFWTFNPAATPEEIPGLRVFYSLTGNANEWHLIDGLSGNVTVGSQSNEVALASSWAQGALLYLLWVDDNADGITDPSYMIDNIVIAPAAVGPVSIVTPPHNVSVEACRSTNLTVVAAGTAPQYHWFHTGVPIPNATNATYNIPSATSVDNGSYFVRVSNSVNSVDSDPVTVTVTADAVPPTVVSTPLVRCDGTEILVHFSELMDPVSSQVPVNYQVAALDGGTARTVLTAVLTNGTNVILTLNGPVQAAKNYELRITSAVKDCPGNGITTGAHIPLNYELCLLSFVGATWKMETNGVDLGTDWRSDPSYDDSAWAVGQSVFDAKSGTNRPGIGGFTVMTWLPLTNGICCDLTNDIPVYYFRTHFNFPSAQVVSLTLRTLSDDFDVAWLNNQDTPAHVRPGLATNVDLFTYSGGTTVGDASAERFTIDPSRLNYGGDNLIAAKIFQANPTSSDITFAYELTAIVSHFGPQLTITYSGGQVHINWPTTGFAGTMQLYQSNTADGSSGWTVVAGQTAGSANITPGGAGTARFYTLRLP